jgi:hypothetical protein
VARLSELKTDSPPEDGPPALRERGEEREVRGEQKR